MHRYRYRRHLPVRPPLEPMPTRPTPTPPPPQSRPPPSRPPLRPPQDPDPDPEMTVEDLLAWLQVRVGDDGELESISSPPARSPPPPPRPRPTVATTLPPHPRPRPPLPPRSRPRPRPRGLVWQHVPAWQPESTPILLFPSPSAREKR